MSKRTHAEAQQTRKKILEAALKVFSAKSFEKTSLSAIAREANVTRGAIYWHFEDKCELLSELLQAIADEKKIFSYLIQAGKDDETDPLGCIRKWMLVHLDNDMVKFFTSTICNIVHQMVSGPISAEQVDSNEARLSERIRELNSGTMYYLRDGLKNAVRRGQLPQDTDIELAASYLHALMSGFVLSVRTAPAAVKPYSRFEQVIDAALTSLKLLRNS